MRKCHDYTLVKPPSCLLQVIDYVETQQGGSGSPRSASSSREGNPASGFGNDVSSSAAEEEDEADAAALRRLKRCAPAGQRKEDLKIIFLAYNYSNPCL